MNPWAQDAVAPTRAPARQRLPAALRTRQILDAALAAFAEQGFAATRMDEIARRAGLSKGGLYAHFASKEEVFEALLSRALARPDFDSDAPGPEADAGQLAQWLVDRLYAGLGKPEARAALRLLIAEGARVPHLVTRWHREVIGPALDTLQALLRSASPGLPSDGARLLEQQPWLVLAPALHAVVSQLIFGEDGEHSLAQYQAVHLQLLRVLLQGSAAAGGA